MSKTAQTIDMDRPQAEARLEAGFGTVARAQALIEPLTNDLGYDLVRLQMSGNERPKLQVMIERWDGAAIDVSDCVACSRAISAIMDVEDPIESAYDLEVTSPGVDRPLTRLRDFIRFEGYEAKLETEIAYTVAATDDEPGRLQKRFRGRLAGVEDGEVLLQTEPVKKGEDPQILGFGFSDLARGKLVITDDLMDDAKNGVLPPINAGVDNGPSVESE